MGAKPAPQQRPEPFHGIHMDFTKAIAIFISGILSSSMVDALMVVSPDTQTCINAVFICINQCTRSNGLFDERLDGLLLHIGKHVGVPGVIRGKFSVRKIATTSPSVTRHDRTRKNNMLCCM